MDLDVALIALVVTLGVTCGLNAYLSLAAVGTLVYVHAEPLASWVGDRAGLLSHPAVLIALWVLFLVEFVADKIQAVDSAWDAVHTFIRPALSIAMAFGLTDGMDAGLRLALMTLAGLGTLSVHATKATVRAGVNASPEPVSNVVVSLAEDAVVAGLMWLVAKHPYIAATVALCVLALVMWMLPKTMRFARVRFLALCAAVASLWKKEGALPALPHLPEKVRSEIGGRALRACHPFFGAGKPFVRNRKGWCLVMADRMVLWQEGWFRHQVHVVETGSVRELRFVPGLLLDEVRLHDGARALRLRLLKTWGLGVRKLIPATA